MTKEEHIAYWVETAERDWRAVKNMYKSKDYLQALFFAHLVLEKLLKACWVKDNEENIPPKIHNLVVITGKTKLNLNENDLEFLSSMNQFQMEGRYPDYTQKLYKLYKATQTKDVLDNVKMMRLCILKEL